MSTKALWKFVLDCGRMGSLQGLFVATDEEVKAAIGKPAYFGEVLGKHSEVEVDELEEDTLTRLTDDADFIAKFEEFKCASGINPLSAVEYAAELKAEREADE